MQPQTIDPREMQFFYEPPGTVRLTVGGDHSYHTVKVYQAWPLSRPSRAVSFLNAKDEEITLLDDLQQLSPDSRAVIEEELRRRYLTARITRVLEIRWEFGVTYWHVDTTRGERDFVVQSISESCVWLGDGHVLIVDVDGTRFEIKDLAEMDPVSRGFLDAVL